MSDDNGIKTVDLAPAAREFLFALAYWVATADHVLHTTEQQWFRAEFGASVASEMMGRLSSMSPSRLRVHVRQLRQQLAPADVSVIAAHIRPWLRELMFADEERTVNETFVAAIVLKMLGVKGPERKRGSFFHDVKPFKSWPNPLATSSRSYFNIH